MDKAETSISIRTESMQRYRETALRRRLAIQNRNRERLARGWETARKAALILYRNFNVRKVAVFGSLVHPERFHIRSDVDLAVWGLAEKDFLRAVAAVSVLSWDIETDLVAVKNAPCALRMTIDREGVTL